MSKPSALEEAKLRDAQDPLRKFRDQFILPTKADLKRKSLSTFASGGADDEPCTYLCGNSLGLQPKVTANFVKEQLSLWAQKGVYGHFKPIANSSIPPWLQIDDAAAKPMARLVGAHAQEVAVMETLTANLHLMMASFYRPTKEKYKVLIEGQAFPSDHFVVESQVRHHSFDPQDAMVIIRKNMMDGDGSGPNYPSILPTDHVLASIDAHANEAALVLLPGVQYYTGQVFDVPRITTHAHRKGLVVGWDLAHAVGNVPLQLHGWDVDFAAWCTYKYLNAGPGAIGGLFVHERHAVVNDASSKDQVNGNPAPKAGVESYRPRLAGWWGSSKESRFAMDNRFAPIQGAAGFQLSNPSALDLSAVLASLSIFDQTSMEALREKSIAMTGYLEQLLDQWPFVEDGGEKPYVIITPRKASERGAQLSVRLRPGLLHRVMEALEDKGVVVDERKPDVVRVAPAPLYNTFEDCWTFIEVFQRACHNAVKSVSAPR